MKLKTKMVAQANGVWRPLIKKEDGRESPMGFGAISHDAAVAHALMGSLELLEREFPQFADIANSLRIDAEDKMAEWGYGDGRG